MSVDPGSRGWTEHRHQLPWPLSITDGTFLVNTIPARTELVYGAGWQKFTASPTIWVAGTYWKNAEGVVQLEGLVTTNSVSPGSAIATLPVGYRPSRVQLFVSAAYGPSIVRVDVETDGTIRFQGALSGTFTYSATPNINWLSLFGMSFRTT